jgi:hypothetical protein
MTERQPNSERDPGEERETTDDLGYREEQEDRAYERAEPGSQPPTSSDPEPDHEPADAG